MRKLLLCDSGQLPLPQACLSILTGAGEISAACDPRKNQEPLYEPMPRPLATLSSHSKVQGRATLYDSDTSKALLCPMRPTEKPYPRLSAAQLRTLVLVLPLHHPRINLTQNCDGCCHAGFEEADLCSSANCNSAPFCALGPPLTIPTL